MKIQPLSRLAILTAALIGAALPASAAVNINFDGADPLTGWTSSGATTSVVNFDGSNRLKITDTTGASSNTVTYGLAGADQITGNGSMSLDFYAINGNGTTNIAAWLASGTGTSNRHAGFGYDAPGAFDWYTFNGSTQQNFTQTATFAANTWYRMTLNVNVEADTFTVFVQGGAFGATPVQLTTNSGSTSTFAFRNGATSALNTIYFAAFSTPNDPLDGMYIDNITVVPEPSTIGLLVGAAGGLGVFLRRRARR